MQQYIGVGGGLLDLLTYDQSVQETRAFPVHAMM